MNLAQKRNQISHAAFNYILNIHASHIQRKINRIRAAYREAMGSNDNFRSVRKARKLGLHLSLEQNEQLFQALQYTPTPNLTSANYMDKFITHINL